MVYKTINFQSQEMSFPKKVIAYLKNSLMRKRLYIKPVKTIYSRPFQLKKGNIDELNQAMPCLKLTA